MSWDNYKYQKPTYEERKPGDYRCIILSAEEAISKKSGNRMLVISLRPSGTRSTVKAFIVDNEYFDSNYSRFLDAFPILQENADPGNCFSWRGAIGAAKLKVNDDGYFEFDRWVSSERAERMPEFEWKAREDEPQSCPAYQGLTVLDEEDPDECPF